MCCVTVDALSDEYDERFVVMKVGSDMNVSCQSASVNGCLVAYSLFGWCASHYPVDRGVTMYTCMYNGDCTPHVCVLVCWFVKS